MKGIHGGSTASLWKCSGHDRLQGKRRCSLCQGPLVSFRSFTLTFNSSGPKTVCPVILMRRLNLIRMVSKLLETHFVQTIVLRNSKRHFKRMHSCLDSAWNPLQTTSLSYSCCLIFFLVIVHLILSPTSLIQVCSFPHSASPVFLTSLFHCQPLPIKAL